VLLALPGKALAISMEPPLQQRIIVIGGSAGALRPLERILAALPANLPATVFVVLHLAPYAGKGILERLCELARMKGRVANDTARFGDGEIFFAPPDRHLIVKAGHVRVTRTPRENLWRPSVDVLFRSAAIAYSSQVAGVILSGALDDGSAGLVAVKRCGGQAIVQSPAEAEVASMPESAMRNAAIDQILAADAIAPALERWSREAIARAANIPDDLVLEAQFAETGVASAQLNAALGELSEFTCSECAGPLWKRHGDMLRFRCMTGHAMTARSLDEGLNRSLDTALWAAIRQFEQRANLYARMADDERAKGRSRSAASYVEREGETRAYAQTLRTMLDDSTRHTDAESGHERERRHSTS
jgi:two-component system, chemotaxis family, protein-glutamate methylesterase/glutaminase